MKIKLIALTLFYTAFHQTLLTQSAANFKNTAQILSWFKSHAADLGIANSDAENAVVSSAATDRSTGTYHMYIQQMISGKPVVNGIYGLHYSKDGKLMVKTNSFVANLDNKLPSAALDVNYESICNKDIIEQNKDLQAFTLNRIDANKPGHLDETKYYYYPCIWTGDNAAYHAISLIYTNRTTGNWEHRILDESGNVLQVISWTLHCNFNTHAGNLQQLKVVSPLLSSPKLDNVQAVLGQKEAATYKAFDLDVESPLHGSRKTLSGIYDTVASPFGWHDADGLEGADYTITFGNNVRAYEDQANQNAPGSSPDGGSSLIFDFAADLVSGDPTTYTDAAIANLFVINNLMHDVTYHYGFDEESGNFQTTNYSSLGIGNDQVRAEAQDGSGTNNANFSTPPDGSAPRMQMFIWNDKSGSSKGPTIWQLSPSTVHYAVGTAQFGSTPGEVPIIDTLIWVNDGGANNGIKGCGTLSKTKNKKLSGNIALIERGGCTFEEKVHFAEVAGARAAVILDTSAADVLVNMAKSNLYTVTIPSVFVKLSNVGDFTEPMAGGTPVVVKLTDSSASSPNTDSDLDQNVIAHEFTHGISNRLTCGPSNTSALANAEQMGEGWSDYVALALTAKPTDVGSTPRNIGNWLIHAGISAAGIRTQPYCTNMAVNNLTYNNVKTAAVNGRTEVHFLGEVWCSMLWDLHWKMIEKYGYDANRYTGTGGNNKCLALVFMGMKLQKCSPGFVDGRNAILQADSLLNGGANKDLIWGVFARRGLGYSAKQGSSSSTSDGTQAFDLPPSGTNNIARVLKEENISLVPNPAGNTVLIEPRNAPFITDFKLFDIAGNQLGINDANYVSGSLKLNVSSLKPGVYIVNVLSGNTWISTKFVKK